LSDAAERVKVRLQRGLAAFYGMSAFDLALRLTLVNLLLRPVGGWSIRPFTLALAALGLVMPGLLRAPALWLGLTILTGLRVVLDWPLPDNHAYLLFYWCLAVTISLSLARPERILTVNARLLIGLVFAFSVLWKLVLSPDFMNGTFFGVTLLVDPRFEGFARVAGGLSAEGYDALREFMSGGEAFYAGTGVPEIPPRLAALSRFLTYWTIAIEAAVAVLFFMPVRLAISGLRDYLLIIFCVTTYGVANVDGFGWLLLAMGVAQAGEGRTRVRLLYAAAFLLIIFYGYYTFSRLL
jgi:hypothetical protein